MLVESVEKSHVAELDLLVEGSRAFWIVVSQDGCWVWFEHDGGFLFENFVVGDGVGPRHAPVIGGSGVLASVAELDADERASRHRAFTSVVLDPILCSDGLLTNDMQGDGKSQGGCLGGELGVGGQALKPSDCFFDDGCVHGVGILVLFSDSDGEIDGLLGGVKINVV